MVLGHILMYIEICTGGIGTYTGGIGMHTDGIGTHIE